MGRGVIAPEIGLITISYFMSMLASITLWLAVAPLVAVAGRPGEVGESILNDLAGDTLASVELLKNHELIDPNSIGFFGDSQAGWIVPLAASKSSGVAFIGSAIRSDGTGNARETAGEILATYSPGGQYL